jgi:hypothetical protein
MDNSNCGICLSKIFPMKSLHLALTTTLVILYTPLSQADETVIITPSGITTSTTGDSFPVGNLINGSGLSATPTIANLGTHAPVSGANAWVTKPSSPDYFNALPEIVLTCTLPTRYPVTDLVIWPYSFNAGQVIGDEAKTFKLTFSTDGTNYGNERTVTSPTPLSSGVGLRLPIADSPFAATHVRVTITDNHAGAAVGGERVGLGELRFIGVVPPVVTTTTDEDDGSLGSPTGTGISLREAVRYFPTGTTITFDPSLSGKTITLTHADGDMEISKNLTIDASALPKGITLDGNNANRHFLVNPGNYLALNSLTLTRGNSGGTAGGAIHNNNGILSLDRCTLTGNSTTSHGGAIYNNGQLTLKHCTLTGNIAQFGGALYSNGGYAALISSTVSGNAATDSGGGISTVPGTLNLANTIVAKNSAPLGQDIFRDPLTPGPAITTSGVNILSDLAGSSLTAGPTVLVGDPKLTPLGDFGGPVQTMHPLIGSPVIDVSSINNPADPNNPGSTDARGFPRFVTGSGNITNLDIGAVEAGPLLTVTNSADSGAGTLRALFGDPAATISGTRIGFSSNVSTITLGGTELAITPTAGLFFDASNLPKGLTISGNNASRVFNIPATATVAMHSLTILNGKAADGFNGGGASGTSGGGIINAGSLSLFSSTLTENRAGSGGLGALGAFGAFGAYGGFGGAGGGGGGIFNSGTLTAAACTFASNHAGSGGVGGNGAFAGSGGNGGSGGGISNTGLLRLTACTFSGNTAGDGGRAGNGISIAGGGISGISGSGGGIHNSGTCHLTSSIVAGNSVALAPSNVAGPLTTHADNITSGDPLLAPLGDYGGTTQTMPLRPGSPARNAATSATHSTDQRGFPVIGVRDIGAYEAGTLVPNYNAFIWETLPNTATAPQAAATFDFDGDGASNQFEWLSQTSPADATSRFAITTQPISVKIKSGQTASFTVVAAGNALSYQWYFGNPGDTTKPITGATSATIKSAPLKVTTQLWVRVRKAAAAIDSASVTATVISPPRITTSPKSKTIEKGKKAKLTVIATGSSLTYQWFKGKSGNTKSPIKNAKAPTYTTPRLASTKTYWVRITNSAGSAKSKTVTVKVR